MRISYNTREILKCFFWLAIIILIGFFNYRWPFYKYFPDIWWAQSLWIGSWLLWVTIFPLVVTPLRNRIQGEEGERDIGDILDELPESYIFLPNINLERRGNIDFVVIGPTGILTIEVKSHDGNITFNGTELLRDGEPFLEEKNFLTQAWAEAYSVGNLLKQKLERDFFIQPVIVFSSPDAKVKFGKRPQKGVYVIGPSWLEELVLSGENTLKRGNIDSIANIIEQYNIKD